MYQLPIVIGPYSPHEAECLTERLLDSKDLYQLLEQTLRGDISPGELLYSLQYVTETFHLTFQEQQKQLAQEGNSHE